MSSDGTDEEPPPVRPSSWSAALAQLPGYPRDDKLRPPEADEAPRTVTPMKSGDDR